MSSQFPVLYVRPTTRFETLSRSSRNGERSSLVRSLIHSVSLDACCAVTAPRMATREEAALAHSHRYLNLLRSQSRMVGRPDDADSEDASSEEPGDSDFSESSSDDENKLEDAGLVDDCPVFYGLWELEMNTIGGAVVAAQALCCGSASVACWFDGGRHHASADSAGGFCYCTVSGVPTLRCQSTPQLFVTLTLPCRLCSFHSHNLGWIAIVNDAVVACKILLSCPRFETIFYIDIDIHHGDGVENAFLFTNKVVTMSFHLCEPGFYPNTDRKVLPARGPARPAAVRIPLRRGIDDETYVKVFTTTVDAVHTFHRPDAIVLQCGTDGVCGDPLCGFNLTGKAYTACVRHVLAYRKPTLILGGGGYHPANAARVWTDVLECCIKANGPVRTRDPPTKSFARTRDIPLCDEYFEHYSPSFSRDIRTQVMVNENPEHELTEIIAEIKEQFPTP